MCLCLFTAVRNDRNKKKKHRDDSCTSSGLVDQVEFSSQEEQNLQKLVQAHDDTYILPTEETFKFVSIGHTAVQRQNEVTAYFTRLCSLTSVADPRSVEEGGRPRFWGLAPKIFLVNFRQFMGLFEVFGENGGGGCCALPPGSATGHYRAD